MTIDAHYKIRSDIYSWRYRGFKCRLKGSVFSEHILFYKYDPNPSALIKTRLSICSLAGKERGAEGTYTWPQSLGKIIELNTFACALLFLELQASENFLSISQRKCHSQKLSRARQMRISQDLAHEQFER